MEERAKALVRYAVLLNKCKEAKGRYSLKGLKIKKKWRNAILCHSLSHFLTLKLFASHSNKSSSCSFRSPSVFLLSIRTRKEGGLANSCSVVSVFSAAANRCSERRRGERKEGIGEGRREEREERVGEEGGE